MTPVLLHYSRCSKSRQALSFLNEKGIQVRVLEYVKDGIDADDVVRLSKALSLHPSEFIRKNEPAYKALETDEFSIEEWSDIIEKNPILLQRPILWVGNQAVIARPCEAMLTLL